MPKSGSKTFLESRENHSEEEGKLMRTKKRRGGLRKWEEKEKKKKGKGKGIKNRKITSGNPAIIQALLTIKSDPEPLLQFLGGREHHLLERIFNEAFPVDLQLVLFGGIWAGEFGPEGLKLLLVISERGEQS
jgi:hypothetical protein